MSAATFTPGPWVVQLATQDGPFIKGGSELIDGEPQTVVAEVYPVTDTGAVEMANARLIAAAPEMLEALTAAADVLHPDLPVSAVIRAAIAKAEGSAD